MMLRKILRPAIAATTLLATPGIVMAAPDVTSQEIVVTVPRTLPLPDERSPYTGAPIATASVTIPVLYEDLDLGKEQDRERLMTRIDRVAYDACKQLDRMFPLNPDANCARTAIAAGRNAARDLLAVRQAR